MASIWTRDQERGKRAAAIAAGEQRRVRIGTLFGAVAGLTFALFTWGLDGWALAQAHGVLPWGKLLLGALPCILWGTLLGWATSRLESWSLTMLGWCVTVVLWATWATGVVVVGTPLLLRLFGTQAGAFVSYPFDGNYSFRLGFTLFSVTVVGTIAGILSPILTGNSRAADAPVGRWGPLVVWAFFFAVIGLATDGMLHASLRTPVTTVDGMIQFVLDRPDERGREARELHVGALGPIRPLLARTREIIVHRYDENMEVVDVLVSFPDGLASCRLVQNQASNCQPLEH